MVHVEVARPGAVMLWNARVVMVIQKESVVSKCHRSSCYRIGFVELLYVRLTHTNPRNIVNHSVLLTQKPQNRT